MENPVDRPVKATRRSSRISASRSTSGPHRQTSSGKRKGLNGPLRFYGTLNPDDDELYSPSYGSTPRQGAKKRTNRDSSSKTIAKVAGKDYIPDTPEDKALASPEQQAKQNDPTTSPDIKLPDTQPQDVQELDEVAVKLESAAVSQKHQQDDKLQLQGPMSVFNSPALQHQQEHQEQRPGFSSSLKATMAAAADTHKHVVVVLGGPPSTGGVQTRRMSLSKATIATIPAAPVNQQVQAVQQQKNCATPKDAALLTLANNTVENGPPSGDMPMSSGAKSIDSVLWAKIDALEAKHVQHNQQGAGQVEAPNPGNGASGAARVSSLLDTPDSVVMAHLARAEAQFGLNLAPGQSDTAAAGAQNVDHSNPKAIQVAVQLHQAPFLGGPVREESPMPAKQLEFTPALRGTLSAQQQQQYQPGGRPSSAHAAYPRSRLGQSALRQAQEAQHQQLQAGGAGIGAEPFLSVAQLAQKGLPPLPPQQQQERQHQHNELHQQPGGPAAFPVMYATPLAAAVAAVQPPPLNNNGARPSPAQHGMILEDQLVLPMEIDHAGPAGSTLRYQHQGKAGFPLEPSTAAAAALNTVMKEHTPLPASILKTSPSRKTRLEAAAGATGSNSSRKGLEFVMPLIENPPRAEAPVNDDRINQMMYDMSDSDEQDAEQDIPIYSQQPQLMAVGSGKKPSTDPLDSRPSSRTQRTPSRNQTGQGGFLGTRPPTGSTTPVGAAAPGSRQGPPNTTSPLRSPDACELKAYLPQSVVEAYKSCGMDKQLYPWQAECLCRPGVIQGRNLVYCAPTSGGKSLVAEILMLRRIMTTHRPALLVLPYVSLCAEKSAQLEKLLGPIGKEVKDNYGGLHSHTLFTANTGVVVCTIERANILINRMLESNELEMLSCLVVDELHMLGDSQRGYQLELLLTKLRYFYHDEVVSGIVEAGTIRDGIQIIGMSATLPNVDVVARWLSAELYVTDWRPVPLKQYLKVGDELRDGNKTVVRRVQPPERWEVSKQPGGNDHLHWLAYETVSEGKSVLIFCSTRRDCEVTANAIKSNTQFIIDEREAPVNVRAGGGEDGDGPSHRGPSNRGGFAAELKKIGSQKLSEMVEKGVAYHHADLDTEERELVELAYRCGAISVLCATSTVAAGVNLPARRVIFKQPYIGRPENLLDGTKYRQMSGRAGRAGIDTEGESILFSTGVQPKLLEGLLSDQPPSIESCLHQDKHGLKRALLEVVASGIVMTIPDLKRYVRSTLLSAMNPDDFSKVCKTAEASLIWLRQEEHKFITGRPISNDPSDPLFEPTMFGKAALASGLAPEVCISIKKDLEEARKSFVMCTELHLTYLCVPITECIEPKWGKLYNMATNLRDEATKCVIKSIGLKIKYVQDRSFGAAKPDAKPKGETKPSEEAKLEQERIACRYWTALILSDILQEVPIDDVVAKYDVKRSAVARLQENSARFANMVASFCERLGWWELEALVAKFQVRVLRGVRPEILSLTEIPGVKAYTARLLYRAHYKTPEDVAAICDLKVLVGILSAGKDNRKDQAAVRKQAARIIKGAREVLERKAKELKEAAAQALEVVDKADREERNVQAMEQGLDSEAADGVVPAGGLAPAFEAAALHGGGGPERSINGGPHAMRPGGPGPMDAGYQGFPQQQQQLQVGPQQWQPYNPRQLQPQQPQMVPQPAIMITANKNNNNMMPPPPPVPTHGQLRPVIAASGSTVITTGTLDTEEVVLMSDGFDPAPEEPQMPPDTWHLGHVQGGMVLSEAGDVQAMVQVIMGGQYGKFAFWFDGDVTTVIPPYPGLPKGPEIARVGAKRKAEDALWATAKLEGVCICWRQGQACYIPLVQNMGLLAELAPLFTSPHLEKVTFDLKSQMALLIRALGPSVLYPPNSAASKAAAARPSGNQLLTSAKFALLQPLVDVRICAFLLKPDFARFKDGPATNTIPNHKNPYGNGPTKPPYNLDQLGNFCMGDKAHQHTINFFQNPQINPNARVSRNTLTTGRTECCRKAAVIRRTFAALQPVLQSKGLLRVLRYVEMPLVPVLAEMEAAGFSVDTAALESERAPFLARKKDIEKLAYEIAGMKFNFQSSDQVSDVLYKHLGLAVPPTAKSLGKRDGYSTGKEVMLELMALNPGHSLPPLIIEYRSLDTLQAHAEGLRNFAMLAEDVADSLSRPLKRIRGSFQQTAASTGRLAMDDPNLQNIPKPKEFQIELSHVLQGKSDGGGVHHTLHLSNIRKAFTAPGGRVILSADYCQLEFRIMAHFSRDAGMLAMFANEEDDPFEKLATAWLKKPSGQITKEERNRAKQLTYALLYGMGTGRLALKLGLQSDVEARDAMDSFKKGFPTLINWIEGIKKNLNIDGTVSTFGGRKRFFALSKMVERQKRGSAERAAVNTVPQGSAAEIAKAAMISIRQRLLADPHLASQCKMLLQVHDEFLFEVDQKSVGQVAAVIRDCMEAAAHMRVPLKVRMQVGPSWGEMEELVLPKGQMALPPPAGYAVPRTVLLHAGEGEVDDQGRAYGVIVPLVE